MSEVKGLLVMDVDSTLVQEEVIDLLGEEAGVGQEVAEITERAMRGELDFRQALNERVATLKGLPESIFDKVYARIHFNKGAKELVDELSNADITATVREIQAVGSKNKPKAKKYDQVDLEQISLFDTVSDEDILKELDEIDVSTLTPIDALNTIYRLQNRLRNRWGNS